MDKRLLLEWVVIDHTRKEVFGFFETEDDAEQFAQAWSPTYSIRRVQPKTAIKQEF